MAAVCKYCSKKFKHILNLWRHVERWQIKVTNICCRFCNLPLDNIEQIISHTRRDGSSQVMLLIKIFLELTMIYNETMLEEALGDKMESSVTRQLLYYLRLHGTIQFQFNLYTYEERWHNGHLVFSKQCSKCSFRRIQTMTKIKRWIQ